VFVVGALVALAFIPASQARTHLLQAKALMQQGQQQLLAGEPEKAESLFAGAQASFIIHRLHLATSFFTSGSFDGTFTPPGAASPNSGN
jgi:hypothetical protein